MIPILPFFLAMSSSKPPKISHKRTSSGDHPAVREYRDKLQSIADGAQADAEELDAKLQAFIDSTPPPPPEDACRELEELEKIAAAPPTLPEASERPKPPRPDPRPPKKG